MLKSKVFYIVIVLVGMCGYLIFSPSSTDKNKESIEQTTTKAKQNITEQKSIKKRSSNIFSRKNMSKVREGYSFTQIPSSFSERKKVYQDKVIFQQKNQQRAKALYLKQQERMQQQAKANEYRNNYMKKQRLMQQRGKSLDYQNRKMERNKYVQSQMARQEWMKRQQKMNQMMKQRAKISKGGNDGS